MKLYDGIPADAWMDAHVEAYLDGTLPPGDRARFEHHLLAAPAWEADVLLAGQIREGLRALPQPPCPADVTRTVLRQARREARAGAWARLRARLEGHPRWRPVLAMAVLVLLVVGAAWVGRLPDPPPTRAAVARSLEEVKWTLAFLSDVGRHTGRAVRREGLDAALLAPMQQALRPPSPAPPR